VAILAPALAEVDSLERVPSQMPTASARAAAPAANGAIGNRRVPGPMTTGAIEAAAWAGEGGAGAGACSIIEGRCSTMRRNSASRVKVSSELLRFKAVALRQLVDRHGVVKQCQNASLPK
jgi:hypothetical protein